MHYLLELFLCIVYESIKTLERISIAFNLSFPNNTISSSFFFFFFIIDLYFLIAAVIAKMFTPTENFLIPIGISANDENAEIETQPVTVEAR